MIPFWNPWDHGSAQEVISGFLVAIKMIRKVQNIFKKSGFGGFGESWLGFCHCNPTYDTFLESLGPWECSGSVSRFFGHHQDDQEGPECPKTGNLEDLGHLDKDFVIVTPHMIPFWNPWNHGSYQLVFQGFLVIIRMIRKVQNFQIHGIWRIWGILTRILLLQPHIWYLFGILGTIGVLRKC